MAQQKKPNILLIMADDVGCLTWAPTIAASWVPRRPTSTALRAMVSCLQIAMPRRAAPRDACWISVWRNRSGGSEDDSQRPSRRG